MTATGDGRRKRARLLHYLSRLLHRRAKRRRTGTKAIKRRTTQYGAIPYALDADGTPSILLITSRGTGRWIIPKG